MPALRLRQLGRVGYEPAWRAMREFTDTRGGDAADEIWLLEHPPVFTQGQAGRAEHLLNPGTIPVLQTDRGGQVTYHGPGQLVAYTLIDLRRRGLGVRDLVSALEAATVQLLAAYEIMASPRPDAPGVYVASGAKIAQLGLRVRRGCSFHGLSLNVDMDLAPFGGINPCGHPGMAVTSMALESGRSMPPLAALGKELGAHLAAAIGYTEGDICWEAPVAEASASSEKVCND